jgi:hypothetical protein
MDKVLKISEWIDTVLVKEMERAGIFKKVSLNANGITADRYLLEPSLIDLRWQVPNYERK